MDRETYLGDGVYARFDGWSIWLRTPRDNGDHMIAFACTDFPALVGFAQRCWPGLTLPERPAEARPAGQS